MVSFYFILLALIIIFLGITIFFAIKNKKLKSHKVKANILYSGLSFLVFIVCFIFVVSTPSSTTTGLIAEIPINKDTEQSTYNVQVFNNTVFEFSIGSKETVMFTYAIAGYQEKNFILTYDGNQSFTLEYDNKTTTFTYNDDYSPNSFIVQIEFEDNSNIPAIIVILILGYAVCLFLIFGTYKSQYILDVRKQIKAEENGRVIEKYNQNIQVVNEQPQNEYKEEKVSETPPPTRVIPPLPPEIKARIEQNKNDDDTQ